MSTHRNRVKMTVSGTPGTGTITLGSAVSGYQSAATAYGGNATIDILVEEGTAWEVARDCTYTNSGTTVTRGTFEASSTGSAVSFTSAAVVSEILTATKGGYSETALKGFTPGGRLTLESGVPVSTTDQTAKTSVYYTPYVHNLISLWDGTNWVPTEFSETTLALGTLTASKPYDVFGYLSSGALVLESLAWTSDTARATAVTLQDGRYCKSGDKTRLLLGTFYTTSTTTTEDSAGGGSSSVGAKRYLSNAYNRVPRVVAVYDGTASWTNPGTTIRQVRATTGNKIEVVECLGMALITLSCKGLAAFSGVATFENWNNGIGVDTTTAYSTGNYGVYGHNIAGDRVVASTTSFQAIVPVGRHAYNWVENTGGVLTTVTVFGNDGNTLRTGVVGSVNT